MFRGQPGTLLPQVIDNGGQRGFQGLAHGLGAYRKSEDCPRGSPRMPTTAAKPPVRRYRRAVPTTAAWRVAPNRYKRPSWRRPLIALGVVIVILGIAAY